MCSASATKGDEPFNILLKLEYVISIIGTARTKKGNNIAKVAHFITPAIDKVASKNPENKAPESPINIFAGLKLKVKNANIEPAKIKAIKAVIGCAGVIATATKASAIEFTVITEPASPSTPSMKLTAFVTPTIHKIVIGYEKSPKSIAFPNGLNKTSIFTPNK